MAGAILTILDEQDDATLCERLGACLERKYQRRPKVHRMPHERRAVLLVWKIIEKVSLGGFQDLLATRIPGDGHLVLTGEALELMECPAAYAPSQQMLSTFPGSRPPRSREERVAYYLDHAKEFAIRDEAFRAAIPELYGKLAEYIRGHRDTLIAKDPRRRPRIPFSRLPHWARVAFAAQCAKIVYPLLLRCWPDLLPRRKLAVQRAIHVAAKSAIYGRLHAGLEGAIVNAQMAAGAAHGGVSPNDQEPRPATGIDRTIASFAAKAAEKAASTARAGADKSEAILDEAYRFAHSAAVSSNYPRLTIKFQRAFTRLRKVADALQWNDQTPVPRELWDRL